MTSEDLEYRECGPLLWCFYGAFASFLMLKKLQFSFTENVLGKKNDQKFLIVFLISLWFLLHYTIESHGDLELQMIFFSPFCACTAP